jgi:hypothetical protein
MGRVVSIIERSSTFLGQTSRRPGSCGVALLAACLALGCASTPPPPAEEPSAAAAPDPTEAPAEETLSPEATEAPAQVAAEPEPLPAQEPGPSEPDPDPMAIPERAPAAAARRPAPAAAEPEPVYTDFAEFWGHFRNGLLKPDFAALARLTSFPVTTRGPSDRAPGGTVDRTQFSQLIRLLLAQDIGESNKEEPLSDYLKRVQTPPPNAVTGPSARVTHLQFALTEKGWRFVGAYLAD